MSTDSRPKLPRPVMGAEDLTEMLTVEIARLRRIEAAARELFKQCDHVLGIGWRRETLTPEGDPLNAAWLKLAQALGEEER